MNTLSIQRPRPSIEIRTPAACKTPVKRGEVNDCRKNLMSPLHLPRYLPITPTFAYVCKILPFRTRQRAPGLFQANGSVAAGVAEAALRLDT